MERTTASQTQPLTIMLIGMYVNKWWAVHQWMPVARAMTRMLKELQTLDPETTGFIGVSGQNGISNPSMMVQYWRSREDLMRYARDKDADHLPAWKDFNQRIRATGACGVWHEIYDVPATSTHSVYVNMPAFGLGKAVGVVPLTHG